MAVTNWDMSRGVTVGKPPPLVRSRARVVIPLGLELTYGVGVGLKTKPQQSSAVPGQKFGSWTVLGFNAAGPAGRRHWLCRCECGTEASVKPATLKRGNSKSCGCRRSDGVAGKPSATRLAEGEASFRGLYGLYRRDAAKRGHAFGLTQDEFRVLATGPCAYCGQPPQREYRAGPSVYGTFLCNGVDRFDSALGYSVDNCRPCCSDCNLAKGAMAPGRWLALVERLAAFNNIPRLCDGPAVLATASRPHPAIDPAPPQTVRGVG